MHCSYVVVVVIGLHSAGLASSFVATLIFDVTTFSAPVTSRTVLLAVSVAVLNIVAIVGVLLVLAVACFVLQLPALMVAVDETYEGGAELLILGVCFFIGRVDIPKGNERSVLGR